MGPVDTRRITGPETSKDWKSFCQKAGERKDFRDRKERKNDEHRGLYLKTGVVEKASGSAYLEQGLTKVIAAVYGPREIPKRSDFSMKSGLINARLDRCPFASAKRQKWNPDASLGTGEMSQVLKEALEATVCIQNYPKTQIDVFVLVLEDDGGVLAASLTASSLALADGSIQMYDLIVGSSLSRKGGNRLLDPTREEELGTVSNLTIGFQTASEQIGCVLQEGEVETDVLEGDIRFLTKAASKLLPNVQKCLIDSARAKLELKT